MNIIKFSHEYKKLNHEQCGVLLSVHRIYLEEQSQAFLEYDTEGIYKLPKEGSFLLLSFLGNGGTFFTTLRRTTPEKWRYYNSMILKEFEFVRA
jgi:hypothetical protein